MSSNGIARVNYFERQFLRTTDFNAEQAYHIGMRRRHNIAHHTWGIVSGLKLALNNDGQPIVEPGMGIDGYGREVILPEAQPLPLDGFAIKNSDVLDVWLFYHEMGSDRPPRGYVGCEDSGRGGNAKIPFYRWQEQGRIRLDTPDPTRTVRRRPEGVQPDDLDSFAAHSPPAAPEQYWPIFLGQIKWDRANAEQPYSVDMANRVYAGLVGEGVRAPSGQAEVQIGTQPGTEHRFAVFITPDSASGLETEPRLAIDKAGKAKVRGDTTLDGNLKVDKGSVEFAAGTARSDGRSPRIYRLADVIDPDDANQVPHNDLRIEMAGSGQGANRVVVGTWSADENGEEKFRPCLTVADDCSITVHGNLIVHGTIQELVDVGDEGVQPADRVETRYSMEALRNLRATFTGGLSRVHLPLEQLGIEAVAELVAAPESAIATIASRIQWTEENVATFVNALSQEDQQTLHGHLGDLINP